MGGVAGRYIPGDSLLHRMDPRAKLFGFLLLTVAAVLTDSIPGYIILWAIVLTIVYLSGMKMNAMVKAAKKMLSFFVIIFLMNALFYSSEDPIWSLGFIHLSEEGMIQGVNIVLRISVIIAMSSVLTMTTKPMGIMLAMEALVYPLKYIRLPAEEMAMILSIAIQFIPTLLEESENIKKAQIARGARFESGKLRERAMAMIPMLVPVFLSAFKRADELSIAMEARGYRGAKNRTSKQQEKMPAGSIAAIALCLMIGVVEFFV